MTAMSDCRGASCGRPVLDRHRLSLGATQRRARAQEIEAEMDQACERAAVGSTPHRAERSAWSRQVWDRHISEAVQQSRARGAELQALRREAAHLDRLAGTP